MTNKVLALNEHISEVQFVQTFCEQILLTPHYAKMGSTAVYAIVATARSLGVSPLHALNNGFYFVDGKVEMKAEQMNQLIRQKGHSIQQDPSSNETQCVLVGTRIDNGDSWKASFSMEDAKLAGISGKSVWQKYRQDMLFSRALSRLARRLFPDVIKGCYVEGEISQAKEVEKQETQNEFSNYIPAHAEFVNKSVAQIELYTFISDDQLKSLKKKFVGFRNDPFYDELKSDISLKVSNFDSWAKLPSDLYRYVLDKIANFELRRVLRTEEAINE